MDTIIDGYNLIFQCGLEGRSRNTQTIERARGRLIGVLANRLSEQQRARTTIVFDAKRLPIKETEVVSRQSGLTVIYAVDHDEADTLIEELIRRHSSPKTLTVVSSDHRLHRAARRRRATPVDSDVWYDRIENMAKRPESNEIVDGDQGGSSNRKSNNSIPEGLENIDWMKEFGFDED